MPLRRRPSFVCGQKSGSNRSLRTFSVHLVCRGDSHSLADHPLHLPFTVLPGSPPPPPPPLVVQSRRTEDCYVCSSDCRCSRTCWWGSWRRPWGLGSPTKVPGTVSAAYIDRCLCLVDFSIFKASEKIDHQGRFSLTLWSRRSMLCPCCLVVDSFLDTAWFRMCNISALKLSSGCWLHLTGMHASVSFLSLNPVVVNCPLSRSIFVCSTYLLCFLALRVSCRLHRSGGDRQHLHWWIGDAVSFFRWWTTRLLLTAANVTVTAAARRQYRNARKHSSHKTQVANILWLSLLV